MNTGLFKTYLTSFRCKFGTTLYVCRVKQKQHPHKMNTAASFDLNVLFEAQYLQDAISATNNGRIFLPTTEQLATARRNPDMFTLTPNYIGMLDGKAEYTYTIRPAKATNETI